MTRVVTRLPEPMRQALIDLAITEWRDISDQAAYLIAEGLVRRGLIADKTVWSPAAPKLAQEQEVQPV